MIYKMKKENNLLIGLVTEYINNKYDNIVVETDETMFLLRHKDKRRKQIVSIGYSTLV